MRLGSQKGDCGKNAHVTSLFSISTFFLTSESQLVALKSPDPYSYELESFYFQLAELFVCHLPIDFNHSFGLS